MRLTGNSGLRIRWADDASMEIVWDARSRLPRSIVRMDGKSGRSLRIDFSDWALAPSAAVDVRIDGAVDGASRAATGRVVMEQLAASGVALRLGAGGLLALSAPGTRIHLDGRGGIELRAGATRLSLRGGELALQDPALGDALQGDLGGLMRIVASPGWREDGTDWVAFSRTFDEVRRKESEAFAGDARAWAEGLAKGLEERETRFLADGEGIPEGPRRRAREAESGPRGRRSLERARLHGSLAEGGHERGGPGPRRGRPCRGAGRRCHPPQPIGPSEEPNAPPTERYRGLSREPAMPWREPTMPSRAAGRSSRAWARIWAAVGDPIGLIRGDGRESDRPDPG